MTTNGELTVSLELIDEYEFRVKFERSGAEILMDEPEPLGGNAGPNSSAVLSAAVGNCLSASLLFCLRKAKIEPRGVITRVRTELERNERGRLRVGATRVEIELDAGVEPDRLERCLEIFEDYCLVTQSVRRGLDVEVAVVDPQGRALHESSGVPAG